MNRRDYEDAISKEVASWPGVAVEFAEGGKHPKAKFTFTPEDGETLTLSRPFAGTPSDAAFGVHQMLGDMRRVMKQLGAAREKPAPSKDEDEAPYRKPNDGAAKRQLPATEKATPKPDVVDQLVGAGVIAEKDAAAARAAPRQEVFVVGEVAPPRPAPPASAEVRANLLAELAARVAAIADGVYFDLPSEVYHAVPRLSASGLQKLCVSPATFWRGSWLDPDRPALNEEQTEAQLLGKAYHTARLEPHLFESTYARKLDKSEHPDALFTADQMKAICEDIGLKKTGTKDELADRLLEHGYRDRVIWTVEERRWEQERAGRVSLPAQHYDQMVADMDRMRENSEVGELLTGGHAEVSVFWTDDHGIPMKARVDYLAAGHWADLKTFENSRMKDLDEALADAMRYNRYYIQATVYRDAVEAVRVGGIDVTEGSDEQRAFVAALRMRPAELDCHYVFQEKKGVPNLLAYEFPFYLVPYSTIMLEGPGASEEGKARMRELTRNRTRLFMKGAHDVLEAKKLFHLYSNVYQPGTPWFPLKARRQFHDEMFHPYWLEGRG